MIPFSIGEDLVNLLLGLQLHAWHWKRIQRENHVGQLFLTQRLHTRKMCLPTPLCENVLCLTLPINVTIRNLIILCYFDIFNKRVST